MTDKTKSQTYNFLLKNKSIEDIKKQENIEVKEIKNNRHGGKTFRIDNANNRRVNHDLSENNTENLEPIATSLTNNEKEQETNNDIWTKLTNYLNLPTSNTEELIQAQKKYIEQLEKSNLEKDKENEQLKNETEKLKQEKHNDINLTKFSYNAITIYDEKQRKNTGIEKIHEEILPINNQIYFITTFVHINQSISEEILCFQQFQNGDIEIMKQLKQYENINKYKNDFSLIEENSNHEKNIKIEPLSIKEFLNQQILEKLKPTKKEWKTWGFIIVITLLLVVVAPICTFVIPTLIPATATVLLLETKVIIAVSFAVAGLIFKEVSSIFENSTQKVKSWFKNKYFKSKDQKEKLKKERESIIKNLTSNKTEIKLETQYDILKQELDNRKEKNPDQLISSETINQNSNIESENNHNFDSSIRNAINQQVSTSSNHNWNKVKCLLTT